MNNQELTIRLVKKASELTGLDEKRIHGKCRTPQLCDARWACFVVMREHGLTLVEIGLLFRRNHATVIHGLAQSRKQTGGRNFLRLCEMLRAEVNHPNQPK